jgi:hypothetical protein
MPTISMCYGVLIKMFYDDHAPPHLHEEYGEYELLSAFYKTKNCAPFWGDFRYYSAYNLSRF